MESKKNTTVALYICQYYDISILIPKRRGVGYCKSVFGGHHSNANHKKFENIKPNWFCGDTCDVDGYLIIDTKIKTFQIGYDKGLKETLAALKEVFPFISEFKRDYDQFWHWAMINEK